jgi:hypothetical protein
VRKKVSRLFDGLGLSVSFLHHQIHYQTFPCHSSGSLANRSIFRLSQVADALGIEMEENITAYEVELTSEKVFICLNKLSSIMTKHLNFFLSLCCRKT